MAANIGKLSLVLGANAAEFNSTLAGAATEAAKQAKAAESAWNGMDLSGATRQARDAMAKMGGKDLAAGLRAGDFTRGQLGGDQLARVDAFYRKQDKMVRKAGGKFLSQVGAFSGVAADLMGKGFDNPKQAIGEIAGAFAAIPGPVGAAVGLFGGLTNTLMTVVEAFDAAHKKSMEFVDGMLDGGKTLNQTLRAEAEKELRKALEAYAARDGGTAEVGRSAEEDRARLENNIRNAARTARQRVQQQMADPFYGRIILDVQTERARSQVQERMEALSVEARQVGLNADAVERMNVAQDLAARTGMSLESAESRLAGTLGMLAERQRNLRIDQTNQSLREQTRTLREQTQAALMSAESAERYRAVQALMIQTGLGEAQAAAQLNNQLRQQAQARRMLAGVQGTADFARTTFDANVGMNHQMATMGMNARQAEIFRAEHQRAALEQQVAAAQAVPLTQEQTVELRRQSAEWEVLRRVGTEAQQALARAEQQRLAMQIAMGNGMGDRMRQQLQRQRDAIDANIDEARRLEVMLTGQELTRQMRTPLEQYEERLRELNRLLDRGGIDADTYGRALEQAMGQLAGAEHGARGPEAITQGSAAAANAVNAYFRPTESREARLLRAVESQREIQEDQRRAQQRLVALVQSGRILAGLGLAGGT